MNPNDVLQNVDTVLVIDRPSKDAPEALALAGFHFYVRGGPQGRRTTRSTKSNGQVVARHVGRKPQDAELVYSNRPFSELPKTSPPRRSTRKLYGPRLVCPRRAWRTQKVAGFRRESCCWLANWCSRQAWAT